MGSAEPPHPPWRSPPGDAEKKKQPPPPGACPPNSVFLITSTMFGASDIGQFYSSIDNIAMEQVDPQDVPTGAAAALDCSANVLPGPRTCRGSPRAPAFAERQDWHWWGWGCCATWCARWFGTPFCLGGLWVLPGCSARMKEAARHQYRCRGSCSRRPELPMSVLFLKNIKGTGGGEENDERCI